MSNTVDLLDKKLRLVEVSGAAVRTHTPRARPIYPSIYLSIYRSASLTLENGCMAIGARRLTAFTRMYTTDTTPQALAKPNPAAPPAVSDVFAAAAAPPETSSALPIMVLAGAAATGVDEGLKGCWSRCCSRPDEEDANAMDTEDDLREEHLDQAPQRGTCTTESEPQHRREGTERASGEGRGGFASSF